MTERSEPVEYAGLVEHMVSRFLQWKLPEGFCPDGGISFEPIGSKGTQYEYKREPVGTNLLSGEQAKEMVRFMLEGAPQAEARIRELEVAVLAEREACATVANDRAMIPADCERSHTEWDTNAHVCSLELNGHDCLCAVRSEEADAIAAAIRARTQAAAPAQPVEEAGT